MMCDNQVVNMTVFQQRFSLSLPIVSEKCVRGTRVFGSLGELSCDDGKSKALDFLTSNDFLLL